MLKCSSDRWVCEPHSLSAGTSTLPMLSDSTRILVAINSPLALMFDSWIVARFLQGPAGYKPRREHHDVAGNMRGEQAVQREKADDVRAAGHDAQHKRQPLHRKRIVGGRHDEISTFRAD